MCGIFGVLSVEEDASDFCYFGLYALQHRGQEASGIAVVNDNNINFHKDDGLVNQIFNENILKNLKGKCAIGHTRYSTTGGLKSLNAQPYVMQTRLGPFALVHNGNLVNTKSLLEEYKCQLNGNTDSELIAAILKVKINSGLDFESSLKEVAEICKGAFSILIATSDKLYALRDSYGVRPLLYGYLSGVGWILSSETCGLNILGAKYIDEVKSGEFVSFKTNETPKHIKWKKDTPKLCIFEMIYFSRPDSIFFGRSLYTYREKVGEQLAKESPADVDLIVGVPDSGIPPGIGYSNYSGIPYSHAIVKNRYIGRTFIQPTHSMRETGVRIKLNPIPDVVFGKRVLLVDDSIVRGNTSRKLVRLFREAGATEVHMRISSPPVTNPCFYGIDTDTRDQLIASNLTVNEIEKFIEVDSLAYLSKEGMIKCTLENTDNFCSACFDGNYPIPVDEKVQL